MGKGIPIPSGPGKLGERHISPVGFRNRAGAENENDFCVLFIRNTALVHSISPLTTHIYQLPIASSRHRVVELFQAAAYCGYSMCLV